MTAKISQEEPDPSDYLPILRHYWLWIVSCLLLTCAVVYALASSQPRLFEATATLAVNPATTSPDVSVGAIAAANLQAETFSRLVTSEPVMANVKSELAAIESVRDLRGSVDIDTVPNTQLINVSVRHEDAQFAADLANATATQFVYWISDLQSNGQTDSQNDASQSSEEISAILSPHQVSFVVPAVPPSESSVLVPVAAAMVLAPILGLGLAGVLVLFLQNRNQRILTIKDVARLMPEAVIGSLPRKRKGIVRRAGPRALFPAPGGSAQNNAYRMLRTKLQLRAIDLGVNTLVVSNAGEGDVGSVVAANLAKAFAETGLETLLIDGNMRLPIQHRIFGIQNEEGLWSCLARPDFSVKDFLQRGPLPTLYILVAGRIPANSEPCLTPTLMTRLFSDLRSQMDVIILDVADVENWEALVLAEAAGHGIVVVDLGISSRGQLSECVTVQKLAGIPNVDIVVHGVKQ